MLRDYMCEFAHKYLGTFIKECKNVYKNMFKMFIVTNNRITFFPNNVLKNFDRIWKFSRHSI